MMKRLTVGILIAGGVIVAWILYFFWDCNCKKSTIATGTLRFASMSRLRDSVDVGTRQEIQRQFGSPPVTSGAYQASYFAINGEGCSATAVGPRTILSARHCFGVYTNIEVELADGRVACGPCEPHTRYQGQTGVNDVELCKLTGFRKDDENSTCEDATVSIPYDRVSFEEADIPPKLLMTGWGDDPLALFCKCKGIFRIGGGSVVSAPTSGVLSIQGESTLGGSVFMTPGDSGGATYASMGGRRWIVGVNSKPPQKYGGPSTAAKLAYADTRAFLKRPGVCEVSQPVCRSRRWARGVLSFVQLHVGD